MWTTNSYNNHHHQIITLSGPLGQLIITANPTNVQHILKTRFNIYQKDDILQRVYVICWGMVFLVDGAKWKVQRQLYIHEFKTDTFHHLVEDVTTKELSTHLLPLFSTWQNGLVMIPSTYYHLPDAPLADAYRTAINISIASDFYWMPARAYKTCRFDEEYYIDEAINLIRGQKTLYVPLLYGEEGTRLYNIFAMGRSLELWGENWEDFKPERWLEKMKARGIGDLPRGTLSPIPCFQAGPRTCLGKDTRFLKKADIVSGDNCAKAISDRPGCGRL
ncbi:hypothetical protein HAX54_018240 [Datura stramonium]|uniref:Cytochrome P450 n=1 Tax=Datura stramonium TaxID=4076 RepID=A0ABS8S4L0_DATST|nr:hypothetical protein [Datura stramonium]